MSRQVQNPNASKHLSREFSVKGALALRLDETVVPVSVVPTQEWTPAVGGCALNAAGVGTFNCCFLLNQFGFSAPGLTEPRRILVERIEVQLAATAFCEVLRPTAALAGLGAAGVFSSWRDFTRAGVPEAAVQTRQTVVPASTLIDFERGFAFETHRQVFHLNVILAPVPFAAANPGSNVIFVRAGDNEDLFATMYWREEPASP